MAKWATAAEARTALRMFLADSVQDNLVKQKPVFGATDGVNTTYITFDDRLIADVGTQDSSTSPLRVFVDDVEVAASGITVVDAVRGEFALSSPTVASGVVSLTASYYYQRSLDAELDEYLLQASQLVNSDVVTDVPMGLQMAAINYAASFAHMHLAQRWLQRKSDQFMLHETPTSEASDARITYHREMSAELRRAAGDIRRSYYDLRHDRGRAPAFGLLKRTPDAWGPRR